jgi:hypothetical protein
MKTLHHVQGKQLVVDNTNEMDEILDYEEKNSSYLQKGRPFTRMVNPTTNSNTLFLHLSMKMVTMRIELQLNNHK